MFSMHTTPSTPAVLEWEDPPQHGNLFRTGDSSWAPIADELRANPHRWAVVLDSSKRGTRGPLVTRIQKGYGPFGPAGAFEARSRGDKVYARFIGEIAPEPEAKPKRSGRKAAPKPALLEQRTPTQVRQAGRS